MLPPPVAAFVPEAAEPTRDAAAEEGVADAPPLLAAAPVPRPAAPLGVGAADEGAAAPPAAGTLSAAASDGGGGGSSSGGHRAWRMTRCQGAAPPGPPPADRPVVLPSRWVSPAGTAAQASSSTARFGGAVGDPRSHDPS